jgi:hypothetical protein
MNLRSHEVFIKCSCNSECLHIEKDVEADEISISIWQRGYGDDNRLSFFQRIRHAWRVMIKGKPYGDQIILNKQARRELVSNLLDLHLND